MGEAGEERTIGMKGKSQIMDTHVLNRKLIDFGSRSNTESTGEE